MRGLLLRRAGVFAHGRSFKPTREVFFAESLPAEDRERVREALEEAVRTGKAYELEHRRDEQGRVVRMQGTVMDIS